LLKKSRTQRPDPEVFITWKELAEISLCSMHPMQPKLKENPRDWLKFTAAICLVGALVVIILARQRLFSRQMIWSAMAVLLGIVVLCALRPRLFRGFYRAGMTVAFYVGQVIGRILLTLLFLLVVTPLGLLLRLLGKDLLNLKRNPSAQSYWQPVKRSERLDQEF
jgi:hypothetical protein